MLKFDFSTITFNKLQHVRIENNHINVSQKSRRVTTYKSRQTYGSQRIYTQTQISTSSIHTNYLQYYTILEYYNIKINQNNNIKNINKNRNMVAIYGRKKIWFRKVRKMAANMKREKSCNFIFYSFSLSLFFWMREKNYVVGDVKTLWKREEEKNKLLLSLFLFNFPFRVFTLRERSKCVATRCVLYDVVLCIEKKWPWEWRVNVSCEWIQRKMSLTSGFPFVSFFFFFEWISTSDNQSWECEVQLLLLSFFFSFDNDICFI